MGRGRSWVQRAVLGGVCLLTTICFAAGSQTKKTAGTKSPVGKGKAPAAAPAPVKTFGDKTAPITMEVFSDFQCPACRQLYETTLRPLMDDYVATGKVYFVHRDMPMSMHKFSRDAARYANAAACLGKFAQVEDAIYGSQTQWGTPGSENLNKLDAAVAAALKPAEMKKVRELMKSAMVEAAIDRDVSLGQSFRVSSTPTVILTHRGQTYPLPGGVTYPLLRQVLDQLLSQPR